MANFSNNEGLRLQKKRNFIYQSVPQNKNTAVNVQFPQRNLTATHMTATSVNNTFSSPRKKRRSSYGFYDKSRSDQQAAEELCSDLPADAFEDDVLDDLGDDFTVEELCEAASVAEKAASDRQTDHQRALIDSKANMKGLGEDYFSDSNHDFELLETDDVLVKKNSNFHFPISSKSSQNLVEKSSNERTAVLFTAESNPVDQILSTCTNVTSNKSETKHNFSLESNGLELERSLEQLHQLQAKLKESQKRVQDLEEQNYEKDGNLKMLQDSLTNMKSEEIKNKEKFKKIEEESSTQIKELKRSYERTVEQLNSKICFQEQEIKQAKEQRQNRYASEEARESPKRLKSHIKISDKSTIPTGQSFYEKSQKTLKSTKVNKVLKSETSTEKKPEIAKPSTIKDEASNRKLEKEALKTKSVLNKSQNVKVVQKLFKLQNTEATNTCTCYETSPFNQSLLALLRLNIHAGQTDLTKKEAAGILEAGTRDVILEEDVLKKSVLNSQLTSEEIKQAVKGIQELLDNDQLQPQPNRSCLTLVKNFKHSNSLDSPEMLHSAMNLLPLLQHHVSKYVNMRIEKDEETLSSTCSSSHPGDLSEVKERDKDTAAALSIAFDSALQSLRCLDVLVSYVTGICDFLFKSFKMQTNEDEKAEETGTVQHDTSLTSSSSQGVESDLLSLVFQLVVPQPNEPSLVSLVSLGVLKSLVEKCPQDHLTWFYPVVCDTLLPQCLSKEFGLNTLSLVIPILTRISCQHSYNQSDECILLKIYQGLLGCSVDLPRSNRINLQLKVITLVENVLSNNNEVLPILVECNCSLELLKRLVFSLDKEVVFLKQFPSESLMSSHETRLCLLLVRRGMFLLSSLVTFSSRLLADLRVLVGHKYNNLIISAQRLLNGLKDIPDNDELVLQDLLYIEHIEESEVLGYVDGIEDMEVCE